MPWPGTSSVSRKVPVILALLTVLGPASIDPYLPVLPALARDLGTSTSSAQLTMTTCLLGLALGQVAAGPISDRHGRRGPLIVGLIIFVLAAAMCGLSTSITVLITSITVLIAMRLVQGLAGAGGLVIAQARTRHLRRRQADALLRPDRRALRPGRDRRPSDRRADSDPPRLARLPFRPRRDRRGHPARRSPRVPGDPPDREQSDRGPACGLLATALLHLPLPAAIGSLFAVAAGAAAVSPPATSLALADYPQFAGTASSMLGITRFAAGALAAPS